MTTLSIVLLCILSFFIVPSLFGLLMIFHVFVRRKNAPADRSNRVNHLRLVWFALTREEIFVDQFNWLKHDEYENIKDKNNE